MSTAETRMTIRRRGRGSNATERKLSRAAFSAWDTRRENEAFARRSKAAKKAAKTRKANGN